MFTIKYCQLLGLFFVYIEGEPHETQMWKMKTSQLFKLLVDMKDKKVKFDMNKDQIKRFKLIARKTVKAVYQKKNINYLMRIATKYGNMNRPVHMCAKQ